MTAGAVLVAYTLQDAAGQLTDHYNAFRYTNPAGLADAMAAASRLYEHLQQDSRTYSATLCLALTSTDY